MPRSSMSRICRDPRPVEMLCVELARLLVVEEDRTAVGCNLLNCRLEQGVDRRVERVERGNPTRERDEHLQLPKLLELLGVRALCARCVVHRLFASSSSRMARIVA